MVVFLLKTWFILSHTDKGAGGKYWKFQLWAFGLNSKYLGFFRHFRRNSYIFLNPHIVYEGFSLVLYNVYMLHGFKLSYFLGKLSGASISQVLFEPA